MEDNEIIKLYWQRDEEAIKQSSEKYGGYCKSIAHRILNNIESTEECMNDTWMKAWDAIPPQKPRILRIFLGTITRNLALNRARDLTRQKRGGHEAMLVFDELRTVVPSSASPSQIVEDKEIVMLLNRWLASLSQQKRVVFVLRYWHCEQVAIIADRMGWSVSKTSSVLQRLRIQLKQQMELEGISL